MDDLFSLYVSKASQPLMAYLPEKKVTRELIDINFS